MTVLSAAAVARLLECEVSTVQARARDGSLPGLQIGQSWVFPEAALLARLNEMAAEQAATRRTPLIPRAVAVAPRPARVRQLPEALR